MDGDQRRALSALALLDEPVRSALYEYVRSQREPVTREAAAEAAGISRGLAAFHLDKLVAAGLLATGPTVARGKAGPGRAPKTYRVSPVELSVNLPGRRYELLAAVLGAAVASLGPAGTAAAREAARDAGLDVGEAARRERRLGRPGRMGAERARTVVAGVLDELGYQPVTCDCSISLRNCPFARTAGVLPEVICALNEQLVAGLLEGLRAAPPLHAVLVEPDAGCCVEVRTAPVGRGPFVAAGETPR